MEDVLPSDRFHRARLLLGENAMARLHGAFVTIVGLGAVGGMAAEMLARSGVGRFRLVDFDTVHTSNINRQILALETTLGHRKVDLARDRILSINPACRVEAMPLFVDPESLPAILDEKPDVLLDAIDSVNPKLSLIMATLERAIPIISSMGAARRINPEAVTAGDISETHNCRLARMIRKRLATKEIRSGVRCVYSPELPAEALQWEVNEEPSIDRRGRKRFTMGSLSTITALFGIRMAHEALDYLVDLERATQTPPPTP